MKFSLYLPYWYKIKKREIRAYIEHFGLIFLMMALMAVYSVFWVCRYLTTNLELLEICRESFLLGLYLFVTFHTFLSTRIPLLLQPAHLIHFNDFHLKKVFIKPAVTFKIIFYFLVSLLGSYLLSGFKVNGVMIVVAISLWNVLFISFFTRYKYYHGKRAGKISLVFGAYIALVALAMYVNIYFAGIILAILTLGSFKFLKTTDGISLAYDKTYNDLTFISKINFAARHFRMADMLQINRQQLASKNRRKTFFRQPNKGNALFQKNLLSFSRLNTKVLLILLLMKWLALFFSRFGGLKITFINNFGLQKLLTIYLAANFSIKYFRLFGEQKDLLVLKSKKGLYLPYSEGEVIKSFFLLGVPILLFDVFLTGLFLTTPIFITISTSLLFAALFYLSLLAGSKPRRLWQKYVFSVLIFSLWYLLVSS